CARALRPRRLLRNAGEKWAEGHVAAAALCRPRGLRAPRARAFRAPAPRGDGLLRSPTKGGERIHGEEEGGQEEEEVRTTSTERQDVYAREAVETYLGEGAGDRVAERDG